MKDRGGETGRASERLVLSIFPGIDLLGRAFEEEGFCVVRGPDLMWGGDIRTFHPPAGAFGGVIGGPPCQWFSRLRHLLKATGHDVRHGNLIPEFERVVAEAAPHWFLMENVPEAPVAHVPGYNTHHFLLDARWLGEIQHRRRAFSFGSRNGARLDVELAALESPYYALAVTSDNRQVPVAIGGSGKPKRCTVLAGHGPVGRGERYQENLSLAEMCALQGVAPDFFKESPFTMQGKRSAIGNAVPMAMGRAVARAVKQAMEGTA